MRMFILSQFLIKPPNFSIRFCVGNKTSNAHITHCIADHLIQPIVKILDRLCWCCTYIILNSGRNLSVWKNTACAWSAQKLTVPIDHFLYYYYYYYTKTHTLWYQAGPQSEYVVDLIVRAEHYDHSWVRVGVRVVLVI